MSPRCSSFRPVQEHTTSVVLRMKHETTPSTPLPAADTAIPRRSRLAILLTTIGAVVLVGTIVIVPIREAALNAASQSSAAEGQRFALQSIASAVTSAIDERDALASSVSPARTIAALTASRDQTAWANLVLYYGGWEITEEKAAAITQWMRAENAPESWWLRNNPLNNGWYTSTGDYFGSYASLDEAAYYAADSIRNRGLYPGIAAALDEADPAAGTVASAIINSGWATGFYGGGSHWPAGAVPMVVAPEGDWGL